MKQPNMIIRMGAAHWDALVLDGHGHMVHFDIRAMDNQTRKTFTFETVKAFRIASENGRGVS